jgi:type I site-specific restriction endonuclease
LLGAAQCEVIAVLVLLDIRYDDLSDAEKDEWDALEWNEEGEIPDRVDGPAVNQWLFNESTVDLVLEHLMRRGLKVDRLASRRTPCASDSTSAR